MKNGSAARLKYLRQNYVPQLNRYACSAASVAMIINAILRGGGDGKRCRHITQEELLAAVRVVHWQERLSRKGFHGCHGVTLTELEMICKTALKTYEIPYDTVDVLQLNEAVPNMRARKEQAYAQLTRISASGNEYILAYFTQGELVGDWFGSHVSPIGAVYPQRRTLLILDVDPEINGAYEVSFERFFNSLIGRKNTYHRRGGGWVRIRTPI